MKAVDLYVASILGGLYACPNDDLPQEASGRVLAYAVESARALATKMCEAFGHDMEEEKRVCARCSLSAETIANNLEAKRMLDKITEQNREHKKRVDAEHARLRERLNESRREPPSLPPGDRGSPYR